MKKPRKILVHPSLIRPLLLAGAERELVLVNVVVIAALVFGVGLYWLSLVMAFGLATAGHWLLVQAANQDPYLSRIYKRHVEYESFYLAQASVRSKPRVVRPSVKPTLTYV
jgi:type IV secretion system protein VirB3